jgi:uncharacterized protein YutE (UPF0331/DUF86 family)
MYFVDRDQIERRLAYIDSSLLKAIGELEQGRGTFPPFAARLGWERVLHLAIESITDIGSLMIDGFIMRDASSYEDIVVILQDEGVFDPSLGGKLYELVKLRRPLVQQYFELDEEQIAVWYPLIRDLLIGFKQSVEQYLQRELD